MKQNTYLVDAGCGSALAYGGSMVRSGKTDGAKVIYSFFLFFLISTKMQLIPFLIYI